MMCRMKVKIIDNTPTGKGQRSKRGEVIALKYMKAHFINSRKISTKRPKSIFPCESAILVLLNSGSVYMELGDPR